MIKVFISDMANDGILRVVEAQKKYLPQFGIQPVSNINEADIICNHGADLNERIGVPSISVCHGLYWSRQPWGSDFQQINEMVVESMRHAVEITAPSEWVNKAIRRGGFFYPSVIYHGIDSDKFVPSKTNDGFVLWNKARSDYVSDPGDVMKVAPFLQNREFRSTIGRADTNLKILGALPHAEMKNVLANAGVYLATARETFGIGTLEAMAFGIPVAGFRWGGTEEIVIEGQTGYLATPGNYQELAECIERCYAERNRLSRNCVDDVRSRWGWEKRINQYADIFKRVYTRFNSDAPKVSVIVTAYKLDKYLPQCLDSIGRQTMTEFECLVVDDANSSSTQQIVSEYASRDGRFRYCPTPNNMGLPGARNFGLQNSSGQYIRHLDCDDFLADNTLELEAMALDRNRGIDIVYGHIEQVNEDGTRITQNGQPVRGGWPEREFHWNYQMAHMNQLPSCVMARRDVYERSGGYRVRMTRQEDAEFWCRVTSLGFRAEKITQAVTYYHRDRNDSKGATEWNEKGGEPDWTSWFPWRWGGHDYRSGMDVIRQRGDRPKNTHLVPFGAQGKPPQGLRFWYVHDFAYPVVSIIVTCGPGHEKYLIDALDSIQAQSYPDWEVVVVNDTGKPWPSDLMGAPWAKVVNMDGNRGASEARNTGYKYTKGKYIVWMDADDYWLPWFLEKMVGFAEKNNGVIYSDLLLSDSPNSFKIYTYPEFQSELVATRMMYPGSSILTPREIVDAVMEAQGGFDSDIPGTEDWDFQFRVHTLGFCAFHVPEPLFIYRTYTSTKREVDYAKIDDILAYLDRKYPEYRNGEKKIVCGCNQPVAPINQSPLSLLTSSGNFDPASIMLVTDPVSKAQMVVVEYVGPRAETFSIRSRASNGVTYRFGNNEHHRTRPVFLDDANFLLGLNTLGEPDYRVVSNVAVADAHDPAAFLGHPISV